MPCIVVLAGSVEVFFFFCLCIGWLGNWLGCAVLGRIGSGLGVLHDFGVGSKGLLDPVRELGC